MPYICPTHQRVLRQSPKLAMTLWRNAMASGLRALETDQWDVARNFFGSAYETALLALTQTNRKPECQFGTEHLIDAGKLLAKSLRQLKRWDEAQLCLLTLQNTLLHPYQPDNEISPTRRVELTEGFIDKLIDATGIDAKLQHSNAVGMGFAPGTNLSMTPKQLH